jgi:hypothetical protein
MITTKSPLRVAKIALSVARECFADYSCPKSPRKFTQPQLVACLILKEFLKVDYRGMYHRLVDFSDLRKALGLKKAPHFTTLCAAHRRLLKAESTRRLLDGTLESCRRSGCLAKKTKLAAMDSTGLETRHSSHYFTKRCERHKAHRKLKYPKLSAICDAESHLILGITVNRGPKPDHCEFASTLADALSRQPVDALVADAGYDSEKAHKLCRERLGIESIIPVAEKGRRRKNGKPRRIGGHYRCRLKRWFPKKRYGQRWQVETVFSMLKRLMGSALRARTYHSQCREIVLRVITLNVMILLSDLTMFYTEQDSHLFSPDTKVPLTPMASNSLFITAAAGAERK